VGARCTKGHGREVRAFSDPITNPTVLEPNESGVEFVAVDMPQATKSLCISDVLGPLRLADSEEQ